MGAIRLIGLQVAFEIDPAPPCITLDAAEREHDYIGEHAESMPSETEIVALPAVLRGLDVSKVETRTDFVRELSRTLPLNEYNLPIYVYNPAFLDIRLLLDTQRTEAKHLLGDMLTNAVTYVQYDHGYPTIKDDSPLWSQLPWETTTGFAAFLQFLELEGARGIHKIPSVEPGLLREWYHENIWAFRAKAYDAYLTAHHARLREKRIFTVQDDQFKKSQKLLQKVNDALEAKSNEHMESLDFDKLVTSFARLAKVQQDSLGIGTSKDGTPPMGSSVEVIMRKAAEGQGQIRKVDNDTVDMESLLSDPQALEAAQELIIKVNQR